MKNKMLLSSLVAFLISTILSANPAYAGGTCLLACNCNATPYCSGTPSDIAACTPNGTVNYQCDDGGSTGTIDSFRTVINGLLIGKCGVANGPESVGCTSIAGPMYKCERACVPIAVTNIACNNTCTVPGVSDPNPCASPNSCFSLTGTPGSTGACRNGGCSGNSSCNCGGGQPDNSCRITCDMANAIPCGAVTKVSCNGTCPGSSDDGFRLLILARLSGMPANAPNCTKTGTSYTCTDSCTTVVPPTGITGGKCVLDGIYKKVNCAGKCPSIPTDATGVACVACGAPNVDSGVCALQPNGSGEIFDSCCPGSVAQRDGAGCTCQPTKDAVYRLFDLINGVMLPVVIILGIFLIVVKGYKIMMSQGDPTALQEGKEGLTSAIIGLIFVLMAVSILRVIIKALISGDSSPF